MKNFDIIFFTELFNEGWKGWKGLYFNEAQKRFEIEYSKINRWGYCEENQKYGILTENNEWDEVNKVNTHPNACKYFYENSLETCKDKYIDFGNPKYHEFNIKILWDFIISNFELYFTKNKGDEYYNKIYFLLNQSWQRGNISQIGVILNLHKAFPDLKEIKFGFKIGNKEDMKGIDIEVVLLDSSKKTIQVKSGSYTEKNYGGYYYIRGSVNDLNYNTDYFAYFGTKYKNNPSSFIVFENLKNIERIEKSLKVPANNIIIKMQKEMPIPEKLSELLLLCSKNNIEFKIQKEEEEDNFIKLDENNEKLIINFSNYHDEKNFEFFLDNMIEKLKNLSE